MASGFGSAIARAGGAVAASSGVGRATVNVVTQAAWLDAPDGACQRVTAAANAPIASPFNMTAAATLSANPRRVVGGSGWVAKEVIAEREAGMVRSLGESRFRARNLV